MATPLFDFLDSTKNKLLANPAAILFIIALLLTLFYVVPVYTILLIVSIVVSIGIGLLSNLALNTAFKHIPFTDIERGIIGGLVSGTMGFAVGTYMGTKLHNNITWGYYYNKQQQSLAKLRESL